MAGKPEYDEITGQYTTGHEWGGLKELNTPLPRWWLWTLFACIAWSLVYYGFMPSWPLVESYTKGALNWSAREEVMTEIAEAKAAQAIYVDQINAKDLLAITQDPELLDFAMAGGKSSFGLFCAQCHGSGASGAYGIANLNDDDWIWGGTMDDIHETIRVGVRSEHDETRYNMMPNFVGDEMLTKPEAGILADYVLSLSDSSHAFAPEAAVLFEDNCAACHGDNGEGIPEMGGIRISDAIWLYGGTKADVVKQLTIAQHGVMPNWEGRLDEATIKQLTVYVHSLGGGQ